MKQKLEKKDGEILNLRADVTKLKKELRKKNRQLNGQMEQSALSVGFQIHLPISV